MANNEKVSGAANNSTRTASFDQLTKKQLIELISGNIENPVKDFAKKICKVKNYSHLCQCEQILNGINKVHITRFIALLFCPLSVMPLVSVRKLDKGNAFFVAIY